MNVVIYDDAFSIVETNDVDVVLFLILAAGFFKLIKFRNKLAIVG